MSSVHITCNRTTIDDPSSGHETCKGFGNLLSLENLLFLLEGSSSFHKQNLFISKLKELQPSLDCVPINGFHMIIDKHRFGTGILKGCNMPPGFSQFQHKKVLHQVRDFGSFLTTPQKTRLLEILISYYKVDVKRVFGTTIMGHTFYRFDEPARYKHAFGLADAVSLAMLNIGVRVKFNTKQRISKVPQLDFYHGIGNVKLSTTRFIKCRTTKKNLYLLTLHYLRNFPREQPEKAYVKLIKLLLAGTFSQQMEQELPSGFSEVPFGLFPSGVQSRLDRHLMNKRERCRFYFNLLQSKGVCAPVGEDMINEAYLNHKASICRPESETIPKDEQLYQGLYELGEKVGRIIVDNNLFDPHKTTLPNTRACIEKSGKHGGNIKHLKEKGQVVTYCGNPILDGVSGITRFEPLVIGLFGPPACGKTTLIQHIIAGLARFFPEKERGKLVYSRSCAMKHWDGYCNQPIVILDDFGQVLSSRDDVSEFAQLVSVNPYLLPMAKLEEKGCYFNSPIIILSSNCQYGCHLRDSTGNVVVEDSWAIWRRVHLPYLVKKDKWDVPLLCPYQTLPSDANAARWQEKKFELRHALSETVPTQNSENVVYDSPIDRVTLLSVIQTELEHRMLFHEKELTGDWDQIIARYRVDFSPQDEIFLNSSVEDCPFPVDKRDHTLLVRFPGAPPRDPPKVKPVALSEPLKVRMITAAESDTKCLQPLQRALWQALSFFPEMCLTNGVKDLESFTDETLPWIYRIECVIKRILSLHDDEDDLWLSGDYTAATDNLPMWVTDALIQGILKHINHLPTKLWAEWECSPHDILYQDIHGGKARQTSGQLMGSLLSFPLLCLANYFTLINSGFERSQFLVNGDDVAARGKKEQIDKWRSLAPRIGLSLSVGKNFIDHDFVTINSQLFFNGEVQHTGKVSCQTRHGTTLGYCFQEAQFYWGNNPEMKAEFIRRNLHELRSTPRSLDLPVSLGGLGMYLSEENFIQKQHGKFKRVYFYDLLKKYIHPDYIGTSSNKIGIIKVPVIHGSSCEIACSHLGKTNSSAYLERLLNLQPTAKVEKIQGDLSNRELTEFQKFLKKGDLAVFERIIDSPRYKIKNFPPLTCFETRYLAVRSERAHHMQNLILESFAQFWIDSCDGIQRMDPWLYFDIEDVEMVEYYQKVKLESVLDELIHRFDVREPEPPSDLNPCLRDYGSYDLQEGTPHPSDVYQKVLLTKELGLVAKQCADKVDFIGSFLNRTSNGMPKEEELFLSLGD